MNKIKTLIISNIAETYHRTYAKGSPEEAKKRLNYDFIEAERGILYKQDEKVVVTSTAVDKLYIEDVKKILNLSKIYNFYPKNATKSICTDILKDQQLFGKILKVIEKNPGISLIPYFATDEFFELLSFLKQKHLKFKTEETVAPKNRFIRNHYNCKVGFRKLWEKTTDENSFVKIPDGFIVDNLEEAKDAAWWFFQNRRNFVIKYNRGTSGFGIVFYRYRDLPKEEEAFKKYLGKKHQDRIWFEENFVVEQWIDCDTSFFGGTPSVEFKVNSTNKHLYSCFQRLDKRAFFQGVIISKDIEEDSGIDFDRVIKNCDLFGQALSNLGYKGIFDIDLVIDKKHNIWAVESNLRRTGGTHVFEVARLLFGNRFIKKTTVVSRDNLPVSKKINTYKKFKEKAGHLYFSKEKKEGIIPAIAGFLQIGKIGYIAFGKSFDRIEALEKKLKDAVC